MFRLIKRELKNGSVKFVVQQQLTREIGTELAWKDYKTYDNLLAGKTKYEALKAGEQYRDGFNVANETVLD